MTNQQPPGEPLGQGSVPTGPPAMPFDPRLPVVGSPVHDPQIPPSQVNRPKRTGWLIGAALGLMVLVGAGAFVATRGDDSVAAGPGPTTTEGDAADTTAPDEVEGPGSTAADTPGPDVAGDHIACPSETPADLCELAAYVETVRGRPFKAFPVIELEENDEFDRRLLELFDEESSELEASGHVMRSLGMIPADADLVSLMRTTLEIGVVGYYDTDTKGLVVRGSEFDLYAKLVLVHELTHAHDDQWIGLDRPELDDVDDESDFGFTAITEGNAQRVDQLWRASLSDDDENELADIEKQLLSPEDLQTYLSLPRFILLIQISPYVDGLALVEQIAGAGGEAGVDAAFEAPPQTSEQVLHPGQYLSGQADQLPPLPAADGAIIDQGVIGELGFRHWLGPRVGEGWGGDRYVTWLDGAKACTRIEVQADDKGDLQEFSDAARDWADEAADRSVEDLDGLVRMTGCA